MLRLLKLLAGKGLAKFVMGKTSTTCGTPDKFSLFSNRVSAFFHACGWMIGEAGRLLIALAVATVFSALATNVQLSLAGCGGAD